MNLRTNFILEMLNRIVRFFLDHPITPALPRATAAHAEVVTTINALEAAAQNQTSGSGESEGGVDRREEIARDLRDYLKEVNRTARTLEPEHPGIRPTFRLPKSGSYPALIAAAQTIIAKATTLQASFEAAGMPSTFLTDLNALVAAFLAASGQKHGGGLTRVEGTAALRARASLGMIAADKLGACVRNHFRNVPEILAAWESARHVERAPRRSKDTPNPTPTPPSGGGSGNSSSSNIAINSLN